MFAYLLSSGGGGCYFSRIKLDGTRVSGAAVDSVDYRRKLFLSQVVIWESRWVIYSVILRVEWSGLCSSNSYRSG